MPLPDWLVRGLIRCYPARFRDEYAREMTQFLRDAARDRGAFTTIALVADVARTAPRERFGMLIDDVRFAIRLLRKSPLFSAVVILTVALAIGANTAIFSVVNAIVMRPLPFARPHELVQVAEKNDQLKLPSFSASVLNYLSWK